MFTLREINTSDSAYRFVETLLHKAFPEQERRSDIGQRENTDFCADFHTLLIEVSGRAAGLFTYWEFKDFCYAEHFAISEEIRGGGVGASVLRQIISSLDRSLVLEVEPAGSTPMAERRIEFYKRCGMRLWSTPYMQPPYHSGDEALPLKLMATANFDEAIYADRVVKLIHRKVYGVGDA